jgi:hypothetical protein
LVGHDDLTGHTRGKFRAGQPIRISYPVIGKTNASDRRISLPDKRIMAKYELICCG